MNNLFWLYNNTIRSNNRSISNSCYTTKQKIVDVLNVQDDNTIKSNTQWWYTINHKSDYIPLSITQHWDSTAIDSIVHLDTHITDTIINKINNQLKKLWIQDDNQKNHMILSLLQQELDHELGIISNISEAESEQTHAIRNSDGIVHAKNISNKMCTMRAWYTAQVLWKIWWEATTICGNMEWEWHARNVIKSPSWDSIMIDPMNPKTDTWYRFVNSTPLSIWIYERLKDGTYTWSLIMNQNTYNMNIAA
jgi:hypothetical protein